MRPLPEIQAMIETLERLNKAALARIDECKDRADAEEFAIFNHNSQLLCALRWVMGDDTIKREGLA